jgi:hypothetical protein
MIILKYKMFKKLILSILLVFYSLFIFVPQLSLIHAQTTSNWWEPSLGDFARKVRDPNNSEIFGERYTYAQVQWIVYSLVLFLFNNKLLSCGTDSNGNPQSIRDCVAPLVPLSNNVNFNSPVFAAASLVDIFRTTQPASGIELTKNLAANFHIIPEAKAQNTGYGFTVIGMAQKLWQASRNFAYALMTLAIVILAFMIMFRVRISPQLSVTIQSALPRVAIGLVLITFSYAIAGFLIDLAYLSQGIVALMFQSANISNLNAVTLFQRMNNGSMGMLSLGVAYIVVCLGLLAGGTVAGAIAGLFTAGAALPVAAIAATVIAIIILVAFIIASIRIFWLLLKTYITVILLIIAIPFQILFGVVSPQSNAFGWVRSLLSHIVVFPAVSVLILFAHTLFWGSIGGLSVLAACDANGNSPINPFCINTTSFTANTSGVFPAFTAVSTELIGFFGALVLLMSIPSIANSIREFVASGRVGRAPQLGLGVIGAVGGTVGGAAYSTTTAAAGGALAGYATGKLQKVPVIGVVASDITKRINKGLNSRTKNVP